MTYSAGGIIWSSRGRGWISRRILEYIPADDVRTIDWNVSCAWRYPYVKIYREERELTIMLLVDVSPSMNLGLRPNRSGKSLADSPALLAFMRVTNNDKVGLLLFTDRVEHFVAPKKGRRHVLRLIRDVLAFKPQARGTFIATALEYTLHALTKLIGAVSGQRL